MDNILLPVIVDFVHAYLKNIIVVSPEFVEHLQNKKKTKNNNNPVLYHINSSRISQPRTTVGDVVNQWKITGVGTRTAHFNCARKVTESHRHVLKHKVRNTYKKLLQITNSEFQQAAGVAMNSNTLRKELHVLNICEYVAADKASTNLSSNAV